MRTPAVAAHRESPLVADGFPEGRCRRAGDTDTSLRHMPCTWAAYSPMIGARVCQTAVAKVTPKETRNRRHCVCDTIRQLLRDEQFKTTHKSMIIIRNLETCNGVTEASMMENTGTPTFSRFHVTADPGRRLAILAQYLVPPTVLRPRRLIVRQLRRGTGRDRV